MHNFITNFILGFILAAGFGQVSLEIFRRGISIGFKSAILTSLGATFADLIYLILSIFGMIFLLNEFNLLKILWFIGGIILFYLGIVFFKTALKRKDVRITQETKSHSNSFIVGFLLNFIHPFNLVCWITILTPIIIKQITLDSRLSAFLNGTGIVFGVLAWWIILSFISSFCSKHLSLKRQKFISIICSITLIGFSVWFFYNGIKLL